MKGGKKGRSQNDQPAILDSAGADVNDPIGNHIVNFTFTIEAEENGEKRSDCDVEMVLPNPLPKGVKPPKIDLAHPVTNWSTSMPVSIDDNFINIIKDKRFIYKLVFNYKSTGSSHQKRSSKHVSKKGSSTGHSDQKLHITAHTLFVDASNLIPRGGRFKPELTCSATCSPPGFNYFKFTITIDYPILSDAQIRRFQPSVCYIKSVHQLPDSPISFEELDQLCIGTYISVKGPTGVKYYTSPREHTSDIKYNIFYIMWNTATHDIEIELHDREIQEPDLTYLIGTSFISPDRQQTKQKVDPLNIDSILDASNVNEKVRPFSKISFVCSPGRQMIRFTPITPKESVVKQGNYTQAGTYITIEMDHMKDHVPPPPALLSGSSLKSKRTSSSIIKEDKSLVKGQPVQPVEIKFGLQRVVLIDYTVNRNYIVLDLQEKIVACNSVSLNQEDLACLGNTRIDQQDSTAISGFILNAHEFVITVLEVLEGSDVAEQIFSILDVPPMEGVKIFVDKLKVYQSPRLYGDFDCAVKKFRLLNPLSKLLLEPSLYVQNSLLSNCFSIIDKLSKIKDVDSYQEIDQLNLWPTREELELMNAKLGTLLTLDELAFPPRNDVILDLMKTRSKLTLLDEDEEEDYEKPQMDLSYVPVENKDSDSLSKTSDFFHERNTKYIRDLEAKNKIDRNIMVSEDGEYEIICCDKMDIRKFEKNGFIIEETESYIPLAERVTDRAISKMLREENGSEIRNGQKFYNFKTPKTSLTDKRILKTDVNRDPWTHKYMESLANCQRRLFDTIRGPLSSEFNNYSRPGTILDSDSRSIYLDEDYNDKINNDRVYAASAIKHPKQFLSFFTPALKEQEMIKTNVPPRPISVQEPYSTPRDLKFREEVPGVINRKKRFNTMYRSPLKKGATDSLFVAKISPVLPVPR